MKIVGILLVRNEEIFVERAVRNALEFCDEFLVVDNGSRDRTPEILRQIAESSGGKVKLHRAKHPGLSHDLISEFAGTHTWVFGVDGDEIYDPAGLLRLRKRLAAGEFDQDWCLFGNVLNVLRLDIPAMKAEGHLSPPCRSMTKLYNFNAIEAWHGPCQERLHGGQVIFREGYHEKLRCDLHESTTWENADFRCLHLCFLRRSSLDLEGAEPRANIMDRHSWSFAKVMQKLSHIVRGKRPPQWKHEKYARGPVVNKQITDFFP